MHSSHSLVIHSFTSIRKRNPTKKTTAKLASVNEPIETGRAYAKAVINYGIDRNIDIFGSKKE